MAKQKEDEDRKRAEEERLRRQAKEKQEQEEAQRKIQESARAPSPVPAASPSPTPPVQPAAATTYQVSPAALAGTFKHLLLKEVVVEKAGSDLWSSAQRRVEAKRVHFVSLQRSEQLDAAEENGEHLYEVEPENHSTEPEDLYQTPDENTAAVAAAGETPIWPLCPIAWTLTLGRDTWPRWEPSKMSLSFRWAAVRLRRGPRDHGRGSVRLPSRWVCSCCSSVPSSCFDHEG